jgi:hypothetical protein
MEILEKVEQLKAELDALRPLDGGAEARIMQSSARLELPLEQPAPVKFGETVFS